jgi:hypothetical protein
MRSHKLFIELASMKGLLVQRSLVFERKRKVKASSVLSSVVISSSSGRIELDKESTYR